MKKLFSSISLFSFVVGISIGAIGTSVRANLSGSGIFPDVPAGSYYDDAIGVMYEQGIITGYEDGKFKPDDPLTRGQIAVIMQRFMEKVGAISSSSSSARSRATSSSSTSSSETTTTNNHGSFQFTVDAFNVSESSPRASISVVRNGGSEGVAKVNYTTTDDTTTAGEDYTSTSGTLTFADGETSQTINVPLKNDTDSESPEIFKIKLSTPTGGSEIGNQDEVEITILDNDTSGGTSSAASQASVGAQGALMLGAVAYSIDESSGQLSVTVERTGGTTGSVTVQYATSNVTAQSGTNYDSANGTLTFAAGETSKTFSVSLIDNSDRKGNKTFTLTLSSPTGGAVLGATSSAIVSIVDDEAITTGTGSIKFEDGSIDVSEGELLQVQVIRIGGTKGQVSVSYTTNNNGAQAGFDYQSTSGTLTFRDGESTKVIPVNILEDSNANESTESFTITISSPTNGAQITSPTMTTISIYE